MVIFWKRNCLKQNLENYENKSKCRRGEVHQKQEQKTFNPRNQLRRKHKGLILMVEKILYYTDVN
jgi:hypothetical protein